MTEVDEIKKAAAEKPTLAEAKNAISTLIRWIGENPNREGLIDTPDRVIKSYEELFSGYKADPVEVLKKTFSDIANYDEMILVKSIRVESYCEHHMIPIIGVAHVAYIPNKKIVGISKLARVVEIFAKRLQTQELLTVQIANTINDTLKPKGVAVLIEAAHQCMTTRGVHKTDSATITSKMIGDFKNDNDLKKDFLCRINNK
ncbi:MAG: GTP cyclohydrolase I FolE [Pseudomonadota bacterium]|nr:GTP cyclohydrolase I FolE [Pseudomonadota bacterium]